MFVMEDMKWDDRVDPGWRAAETPTYPDAPAGRARRTQAVRLRRRAARHRAARGVEALLRLAAPVPDWRRQLSLSEFGSSEWFELAQQMFDFTGDNVFVIGTVGEAPNILLTNNDLRNVPTEFPVSNTDWKGNLMYWADQLWLDR